MQTYQQPHHPQQNIQTTQPRQPRQTSKTEKPEVKKPHTSQTKRQAKPKVQQQEKNPHGESLLDSQEVVYNEEPIKEDEMIPLTVPSTPVAATPREAEIRTPLIEESSPNDGVYLPQYPDD